MSKPPVSPAREEDLKWKPRRMVSWFDPIQLIGTGTRSLLSSLFGAYADKREVQAALTPNQAGTPRVYSEFHDRDELWIDFTADLGDGFDATFSIARLLAQPDLQPHGWKGPPLPRGQILILGGDQVYPTARREDYHARFECPYRFALPWVEEPHHPHLFAIPGNHDWYDGLTSFTRLFCQRRWIGAWKTQQHRSYFALRLPHNWWLWGIDVQLEADIDLPQLDYFRSIAEDPSFKGARVILCTGSPSWVELVEDARAEERTAYKNLGHFENTVIHRHGGRVEVTLTGDMHHYSRYENAAGDSQNSSPAPQQKITAGGGGAYLYGTHGLPERIVIDNPEDGKPPVPYQCTTTFPSRTVSRLLALKGIWKFPFRNWKFSLLFGAFYTLNAWIVQSASRDDLRTLLERLSEWNFSPLHAWNATNAVFHVLVHSPVSFALAAALISTLSLFADARTKLGKLAMGVSHGAAHLALNFFLCWALARADVALFADTGQDAKAILDSGWNVLGFMGLMLVTSAVGAGVLFSLYLVVSQRFWHRHMEEVFSSQSIADYKNFLRLHITPEGSLRIFPIGLEKVCKAWSYVPNSGDGQPFYIPAKIDPVNHTHLIEPPIHL